MKFSYKIILYTIGIVLPFIYNTEVYTQSTPNFHLKNNAKDPIQVSIGGGAIETIQAGGSIKKQVDPSGMETLSIYYCPTSTYCKTNKPDVLKVNFSGTDVDTTFYIKFSIKDGKGEVEPQKGDWFDKSTEGYDIRQNISIKNMHSEISKASSVTSVYPKSATSEQPAFSTTTTTVPQTTKEKISPSTTFTVQTKQAQPEIPSAEAKKPQVTPAKEQPITKEVTIQELTTEEPVTITTPAQIPSVPSDLLVLSEGITRQQAEQVVKNVYDVYQQYKSNSTEESKQHFLSVIGQSGIIENMYNKKGLLNNKKAPILEDMNANIKYSMAIPMFNEYKYASKKAKAEPSSTPAKGKTKSPMPVHERRIPRWAGGGDYEY